MCSYIYMRLFYQISAWVFLIHMFLYAGFYCIFKSLRLAIRKCQLTRLVQRQGALYITIVLE